MTTNHKKTRMYTKAILFSVCALPITLSLNSCNSEDEYYDVANNYTLAKQKITRSVENDLTPQKPQDDPTMYYKDGSKTYEVRYEGINLLVTFTWDFGRWDIICPKADVKELPNTGGYKTYKDVLGNDYYVKNIEFTSYQYETGPQIHDDKIEIPDFRIYFRRCVEEKTPNGYIYKLCETETKLNPISVSIKEFRIKQ